mmetsp:Transcript_29889/g.114750  ORF Transcript_29889/g.114750 Transcript_29889/m.114750 type:complete len:107 (+) Transcript_29889:196-516(+)
MKELSPLLTEAIASDYDVAAIDEAQFFPDLLSFCLEWVDKQKKTVLVAGLDADCERRKFGEVLDLAPHADRITKLSARCGKAKAEEGDRLDNGQKRVDRLQSFSRN